jgi:hypothetical protein
MRNFVVLLIMLVSLSMNSELGPDPCGSDPNPLDFFPPIAARDDDDGRPKMRRRRRLLAEDVD